MSETKTVAEIMIEQLTRIAYSLDRLEKAGLPKILAIYYIQKKTHLSQRDIKAVLDALKDLNREVKIPIEES